MATVAKVAKASLQRILVQGSEASFEPDEYEDFIFAMNNYMLALDAEGVALGYTQVYGLGDEVTVPVGALRGVIANMAVEVAPDYNGTITEGLKIAAVEGMRAMRLLGQHIAATKLPSTLPVGSGNEGTTLRLGGSHYYGDTEAEILAETTGAISLEIHTNAATDKTTPVEPDPPGPPMIMLFAAGSAIPTAVTVPWAEGHPSAFAEDPNVVTLPLPQFGEDGVTPLTYDFTVNWGDGTSDRITEYNSPATAHSYPDGIQVVTITGVMEGWRYGVYSFRDQLVEIRQWGTVHLKSVLEAFSGCRNMVVTATDLLDLLACRKMDHMFHFCRVLTDCGTIDTRSITSMRSVFSSCIVFNRDMTDWVTRQVTDISGIFGGCYAFTGDVSNWQTGAVEDMDGAFQNCIVFDGKAVEGWDTSSVREMSTVFDRYQDSVPGGFNPDLSGWDTSSVTLMKWTFEGCRNFTGESIENWDVSKVLTMHGMLRDCALFNADLSAWDVSRVVDFSLMFSDGSSTSVYEGLGLEAWDTSSAELMDEMFVGCDRFNGDVSGWNTSKVRNMDQMFHHILASAFDRDISGWDISRVENVSSARSGFNDFIVTGLGTVAFSVANYDALLNAWSGQSVNPGLSLHIDQNYTIATSQAARDVLTGAPNNWIITDKGGI